MAFGSGFITRSKSLSPEALGWLRASGLSADDTVSDLLTYTVPYGIYSFSAYKAEGLSDDAVMSAAIARGGTLILDPGQSIHLTQTFTIKQSMQIISDGTSTIETTSAGGLFLIAASTPGAAIAPVLFQGLNILNLATSGSIIVMSGDHTVINGCQFANVAGNSASMVKFQGYDQVIENSTFSNYEPTAYSWDAIWVDGYNGVDGEPVNDRVVGGAAIGPGKGGLIANAGLHFPEGFSVDDWVCTTQGVQIQANDVYSLEIRGGVFEGAKGSAIVLGGGNALVQSVVIQGAYVSAAGTAIDAAPASGSGVNDLTVQDNLISGSGTGIALNGRSGHATIIGNTITSSSLGLSLQSPASPVVVVGNTVTSGGIFVSDSSANPNQAFFGNTINGSVNVVGSVNSSTTFISNVGTAFDVGDADGHLSNATAPVSVVQAVQVASKNIQLPNFTQNPVASAVSTFPSPGSENTFSHFKNPTPGIVLTDDQAFAQAIATLGAVHGTLVIDNGLHINLTQTVDITNSIAIVSAGSGLDTSSIITTSAPGAIFKVSAIGTVLIQGLNFKSGASGSIITTGIGNTVLRGDEFTNVAGNTSSMIVLQGPNQLIQDSYFYNNEAAAYDWNAAYIDAGSVSDKSTTISGGWAYGIGKGGLVGGDNAGPVIRGFNINNWTIVSGGATQLEANNVSVLDIEGGVFDGSSGSAITLGGGATRINSVTVNGAFVSAAGAAVVDPKAGVGINAGLLTGAGVANLTITDNQINTVGTGVLAGGNVGNLTVLGNALRTGKVGLDLRNPSGAIVVVGNQNNPDNGTIAVQSTTAAGSTSTYVANTFNGEVLTAQTSGSSLSFVGNIGSGTIETGVKHKTGVLVQSGKSADTASSSNVAATSSTAPLLATVAPVAGTQQGKLTLQMSETAWHGDAQFSLKVDGVAVGGTLTVSAQHGAGQTQTFTVAGLYAPGPHTVGVTLLNSLTGADGKRALFVDSMTFNGQDSGQSATLSANSTALLSTSSVARTTAITVNLSEESSQGDAQAFISIDGKIQGGLQTITALHNSGSTQAMSFLLDLAPGLHTGAVTLLNGFSEGSGASRNLFVDSIGVAGAHYASTATSLGSSTFAFSVQPAPIASGSLILTAGQPSTPSLLIPSS